MKTKQSKLYGKSRKGTQTKPLKWTSTDLRTCSSLICTIQAKELFFKGGWQRRHILSCSLSYFPRWPTPHLSRPNKLYHEQGQKGLATVSFFATTACFWDRILILYSPNSLCINTPSALQCTNMLKLPVVSFAWKVPKNMHPLMT